MTVLVGITGYKASDEEFQQKTNCHAQRRRLENVVAAGTVSPIPNL